MPLTVRKHNGKYWFARGTVPIRLPDGTIGKKRVEESTGEETRARAIRFADQLWARYQEEAFNPKPKSIGFSDAAIIYTRTKNPSKTDRQILGRLIEHFGDKPIREIGQKEIIDCCTRVYPGRKAATLHRSVFGPVTAVLRLNGLMPVFEKPKVERVEKDIPDDDWFDKVLPHCDPQLAAYLLFITITGRRPTEALKATYDGRNSAIIARDKTGHAVCVPIPSVVASSLTLKVGERLFSYGDYHNVYRVLRRACEKAGVRFYGLHSIGRHTAATRLLNEGYSTKFVADALGWATTRMIDYHYGHLAKDEVAEEAQKAGEEWLKRRKTL